MKFLTISFLFLLCSPSALAGTEVKLGLLLFPPDVMLDHETNECVGKNVTITRELLAGYDINVQVICSSHLRIYPMIVNGEVDLTINIKSTETLARHVGFTDVPFGNITLNLYTHIKPTQAKSISAVMGYDYQGYRLKYSQQGFNFIDLPSTISALQVFLKEKTDYLLSYDHPIENYMSQKKLSWNNRVTITTLQKIDTYYAVVSRSPHYDKLMQAFNDFAVKNQVEYLKYAFP